MEIKYLPDYNEEYSIKMTPGVGTASLAIKLDDGWNLSSLNMSSDQKVAEIIGSVAQLVGAIKGAGAGGAGSGGGPKSSKMGGGGSDLFVIMDARPDVPLGFYEPIIATDPNGCKSLFGWRYVGFAPFAGCPVAPCVQPKTITCEPYELWGIVSSPTGLKFSRLSDIENNVWPYKYKQVKSLQGAGPNELAPPPGFYAPKDYKGEPGSTQDCATESALNKVRELMKKLPPGSQIIAVKTYVNFSVPGVQAFQLDPVDLTDPKKVNQRTDCVRCTVKSGDKTVIYFVAVSGDGTAGLTYESDATTQQELKDFAAIQQQVDKLDGKGPPGK